MSLRQLFENTLKEDYKTTYNDYADRYNRYKKQTDYIFSRNRNRSFVSEEGPFKIVYTSYHSLNDIEWSHEHPADGDLQIFINGDLVYEVDGGEGGYLDEYGRRSELSSEVFYLLTDSGEYSYRAPLMQLLKIALRGKKSGEKLFSALEGTFLPLMQLSSMFNNTIKDLRKQLNIQSDRAANVGTAIRNRQNTLDKSYDKYTSEFGKESLADLNPGDEIELPYYLGGKSTLISVSSTGKTFKVKDSSGKNRVIKVEDYFRNKLKKHGDSKYEI